jgi:hypothetical protein
MEHPDDLLIALADLRIDSEDTDGGPCRHDLDFSLGGIEQIA